MPDTVQDKKYLTEEDVAKLARPGYFVGTTKEFCKRFKFNQVEAFNLIRILCNKKLAKNLGKMRIENALKPSIIYEIPIHIDIVLESMK